MTQRLATLLLLLLGLSLSLPNHPADAAPRVVREPTRLTRNAHFENILAWRGNDLVAMDGASAALISTVTGQRSACNFTGCDAPTSQAEIEVEATTHRLLLNGVILLETSEDILGNPALSQDGQTVILSKTPHGAESASLGELWRYSVTT